MSKYHTMPCGCKFEILQEFNDGRPPKLKFDYKKDFQDCKAMWNLLWEGKTLGIFQLESGLGKHFCKQLCPENVLHVEALGAILRPGCLQSKDDNGISITQHYCNKKNGKEEAVSSIPALTDLLKDTYGEMIFQEDIMRISIEIAGFDGGGADDLRKGVGSKDAKKLFALEEKFLEGCKLTGKVSEEEAKTIFGWIKSAARYSFNKCCHKSTIIKRLHKGKYLKEDGYTVEHMYKIRNNIEYAKQCGQISLHKKWKLIKSYGKGLSLCEDGRIRPNTIIDIQPAGQKLTFKVVLENKCEVIVTDNHKFPTPNGLKPLYDLKCGDELYTCGNYESTNFNVYKFSSFTNKNREVKTDNWQSKIGGKNLGINNHFYTNGAYSQWKIEKDKLPDYCELCKKTNCRLETHHINKDRTENKGNLINLCVSCHKKEEYKLGRKKIGEKGYPSVLSKIISITPYETTDTYDVTMDGPNHNFVVGGNIIIGNSHSNQYSHKGCKTLFLKFHFPVQFYTSKLKGSINKIDTDYTISELVEEAKLFDINVKLPSLSRLKEDFFTDGKDIYFGITNIKGIGNSTFNKIYENIKDIKVKKFSFFEFCIYVAVPFIPNSTVIKLIESGALDFFNEQRINMLNWFKTLGEFSSSKNGELERLPEFVKTNNITSFIELFEKAAKTKKEGGLCHSSPRVAKLNSQLLYLQNYKKQTDNPIWKTEKEEYYLGIPISCRKVDAYDTSEITCSIKDYLEGNATVPTIFGGDIVDLKISVTKTGKNIGKNRAELELRDLTGKIKITVWSDAYEKFSHLIIKGNSVIIEVERGFGSFSNILCAKMIQQAI